MKPLMLVPLLIGATQVHAAGPSFDCEKAHSAIERAICASPDLAAYDVAVAAAYQRALASVGSEGATQLRASQRGWLGYLRRACVAPGPGGVPNSTCLGNEMARRPAQLNQVGWTVGPYRLTRVDLYGVTASEDPEQPLTNPGRTTHHVAFPQIEPATTPDAVAWNARQRLIPSGNTATDTDVDYEIACAGDVFVSIATNHYEYGHGAAHGITSNGVSNQVLVPTFRMLTEADLFAPGVDWKTALPPLFDQAFDRRHDTDHDTPAVRELIRSTSASGSWLLTPEGLTLQFGSYDGGCYACTPEAPTVPWSQLKPLLARPGIAACEARVPHLSAREAIGTLGAVTTPVR